jgi:hypothetical protein
MGMDKKPSINANQSTFELLQEEDFEFIHRVLGSDLVSLPELKTVLQDNEMRQDILDSRCLYNAINDEFDSLKISLFFYLYTVIRQIMLDSELEEEKYTLETTIAYVKLCRLVNETKNEQISFGYPQVELQIFVQETESEPKVRISTKLSDYLIVLENDSLKMAQSQTHFRR